MERKKGSCLKTILIVFIALVALGALMDFLGIDDNSTTNKKPKNKVEEAASPKSDDKEVSVENKEKEKSKEEPKQESKPEDTEQTDNNDTLTEQPVLHMLDDATKNALKEFVEPCINDTYKTNFYTCDILTPTDGPGGIVSIQIESSGFTDEGICKETVKAIINQMLGDERYKNINSFEFFMLADSQMKYILRINDAQAIGSVDDIADQIETTGF